MRRTVQLAGGAARETAGAGRPAGAARARSPRRGAAADARRPALAARRAHAGDDDAHRGARRAHDGRRRSRGAAFAAAAARRDEPPPPRPRLGMEVLERLLGLELKMRQYEQGRRFCDAIVEAGGPEALARAWSGPESLPSRVLHRPAGWQGLPTGPLAGRARTPARDRTQFLCHKTPAIEPRFGRFSLAPR